MAYSGVIFDFNGTLFWDTKLHNKAWNIFLQKYNKHLTDKELFEKIHGKNNADIFRYLFGDITEKEIQGYVLEKELLYQQLCLETNMQLAPGAIDFFNFLKSNGIPFTIATASGKENVDFYFEHLPLNKWFDPNKIVYNNGHIKGKPDPEIYHTAMGIISKKPEDIVVFEDANMGLLAAKNAKAGRIIIVNSNDDDYSSWDGLQIIKDFAEVDRKIFTD